MKTILTHKSQVGFPEDYSCFLTYQHAARFLSGSILMIQRESRKNKIFMKKKKITVITDLHDMGCKASEWGELQVKFRS